MNLIWVDYDNLRPHGDNITYSLKDFIEGNEPIVVGAAIDTKDSWGNTCKGTITELDREIVKIALDADTYVKANTNGGY